eukprot:752297-Hanusia_phi.AAC.4
MAKTNSDFWTWLDPFNCCPAVEQSRDQKSEIKSILNEVNEALGSDLHRYAALGDCEKIRQLVICEGRDPNSPDRYGRTPLMHACRYGRKDAAQTLVRVGAKIATEDIFGATAMNFAMNAHQEWERQCNEATLSSICSFYVKPLLNIVDFPDNCLGHRLHLLETRASQRYFVFHYCAIFSVVQLICKDKHVKVV